MNMTHLKLSRLIQNIFLSPKSWLQPEAVSSPEWVHINIDNWNIFLNPQSASDFARTSAEADVCKDLIDNYRDLFNVTKEELDREEAIMRKTENFNRNPNPVKVSLSTSMSHSMCVNLPDNQASRLSG